jgi:hypothetical protein
MEWSWQSVRWPRKYQPFMEPEGSQELVTDELFLYNMMPFQRIFPLASVSRPALRPTQPLIQWVNGVLSPRVKRGPGVKLATHPELVPRSGMSRRYTSTPLAPAWCIETALLSLTVYNLQWCTEQEDNNAGLKACLKTACYASIRLDKHLRLSVWVASSEFEKETFTMIATSTHLVLT